MSTMAGTDTVETTAPTTTVPVTAVEPASTQAETTEVSVPAEEKTPVTDGVLGYKAPGLIK